MGAEQGLGTIHDEDAVGAARRADPVRYHDVRAVTQREGMFRSRLGDGIEMAGRLVEGRPPRLNLAQQDNPGPRVPGSAAVAGCTSSPVPDLIFPSQLPEGFTVRLTMGC